MSCNVHLKKKKIHMLIQITVDVDVDTFFFGKNTILVPIFWNHGQFNPYILIVVNFVPAIFNLQSI